MKSVSAIVEVRSGISLPSTPWEVSLPVALSFDIIFFHVPQGSESFNHFMNSALLQYVGKSCSRNVFFKMTIVNFSLSDIPLERTSSLSLSLSLFLSFSLSLSPLCSLFRRNSLIYYVQIAHQIHVLAWLPFTRTAIFINAHSVKFVYVYSDFR